METKMRKSSREMSAEWAIEVMKKAPYITMSVAAADGTPYAVALSMAMADDETLYFHCAQEGKKLDILARNPKVCLTAVSKCKPTVGPKDGSFTLEFQSATAFGTAELVTDDNEKIHALRLICQRFLPRHMDAFDDSIARSLCRTAVVRIRLCQPPTGKRKQYDNQGEEMKWQRME